MVATATATVSPFRRVREEAGYSLMSWARVTGVSVTSLREAESGAVHTPTSLLAVLGRRGHDTEALAREYTAWRSNSGPEAA